MIHVYECSDGATIYFEIYRQALDSDPEALNYVRTLENENELDLQLDILRANGVDFVIHTLKEYDEYHLSLSQ
jgi:hypothetical protein